MDRIRNQSVMRNKLLVEKLYIRKNTIINSHEVRSTLITLIIAVIILALISTPAMAISKSDLLSFYKSQSGSTSSMAISESELISSYKSQSGSSPKPMISPTPVTPNPSTPSEISSFQRLVMPIPTSSSVNLYFPSRFSSLSGRLIVSPTPPSTTGDSSAYIRCPPGIPVGPLTRTWCTCMCYIDATTGEVFDADCMDSEGNSYPIGVDRFGNYYLVKPGCQCTWAE